MFRSNLRNRDNFTLVYIMFFLTDRYTYINSSGLPIDTNGSPSFSRTYISPP